MQDADLMISHAQRGANGDPRKHLRDTFKKLNIVHNGLRKRALLICFCTIIFVLIVTIVVCAKLLIDFGIVCPFYEIFDIYCPGCGGTRMAISMLELDFYQAFRYNPFIFCTSPLIAFVYVWQSYEFIFKNRISAWLDKALIIYAILLIMFGIIRNIGVFRWLAPTIVNSIK